MDLDDVCVYHHVMHCLIHYTQVPHTHIQVCLSVIVVPGYTGEHVCSVCAAHTPGCTYPNTSSTLVVRRLTRNQLRQHSRPVLHGY